MQRDPRAWLWHVQQAANSIAEFTNGMDERQYLSNRLVRAAVERQFEIIGARGQFVQRALGPALDVGSTLQFRW